MKSQLYFRKSNISDIERILKIIDDAKSYFKDRGIEQWQNGYPNRGIIENDISLGNGYVLLNNNSVVATVCIIFDSDKNYDTIYEGKWISSLPYAVIHRIAVCDDYKGKGVSSIILREIENMCKIKDTHSIKVDTHENNMSMRRFLEKNGFKYCGIIYLEDENKRVAYEKLINK